MEHLSNAITVTLDGDINDSTVTVVVDDGSVLPEPNFRIRIDDEYMLVTNISTNTLTVTRGVEDSSQVSHTNGAAIKLVLTAGALEQLQADLVANDTIAMKPGNPTHENQIYIPTNSGALALGDSSWYNFGPLFSYKKPATSGWSWFEQLTATTSTDDLGPIVTYDGTAIGYRGRERALLASADFTITCCLAFNWLPDGASNTLMNSVYLRLNNDTHFSIEFVTFVTSSPNLRLARADYNSGTSTWSFPQIHGSMSNTYGLINNPMWFRFVVVGTLITAYGSNDKVHWFTIGSYNHTTHYSATLTHFGYAIRKTVSGVATIQLLSCEET